MGDKTPTKLMGGGAKQNRIKQKLFILKKLLFILKLFILKKLYHNKKQNKTSIETSGGSLESSLAFVC